ncbi:MULTISPECIES: phosphoribosylamine--glycine ligase [unclassified Cyanobium]|uniref:phosphoribosylamine--glycine ligase n=1 Tax=unclassified Cyanobium TaxID=2627006 RepID=UPI0020CCA433|nr:MULTISPECIES: phosphoribosylamine--glycine ligase [unclassified Cyanobium]MCP9833462.1 phosphoribosylamine--glycine ligase [Cyanobium sp. La Preciosa 7G6]MCP9936227.1 phosphoribosylamine--glycine ligase [Cyanobium sp. Aljojuca 7A6]
MASSTIADVPPVGPVPARVLVVGGGGRENALGWALARCPGVEQVLVAPGNGGTSDLAGCGQLAIAETDQEALAAACRERAIDLVVVGPEAPLAAGLADRLRSEGLAVFGPGADGALLEASKRWAKDLMREAGVPTAGYWAATSRQEALEALERHGRPLVVKADGLAAGKGVTVADSLEQCRDAIEEVFAGRFQTGAPDGTDAAPSLVLEERLHGPEVSVFALTDGRTMVLLPPAQDHKRIGEGDTGPNTGGMGAYAPARLLDRAGLEQVRQLVLEPILAALRARGIDYRGVIFAGLMLTEEGLQVIEFNCRFGDPECETLMPLLGPELARVLLACATGRLEGAPPLTIEPRCSACVIAAAEGYPGEVRRGDPIHGDLADHPDLQLFHAGSRRGEDGHVVTAGGRVLAVVAQAEDFDTAFERAYAGLGRVGFKGMVYRRDIGHQVRTLPPVRP